MVRRFAQLPNLQKQDNAQPWIFLISSCKNSSKIDHGVTSFHTMLQTFRRSRSTVYGSSLPPFRWCKARCPPIYKRGEKKKARDTPTPGHPPTKEIRWSLDWHFSSYPPPLKLVFLHDLLDVISVLMDPRDPSRAVLFQLWLCSSRTQMSLPPPTPLPIPTITDPCKKR